MKISVLMTVGIRRGNLLEIFDINKEALYVYDMDKGRRV
jgi:hypothetical protein